MTQEIILLITQASSVFILASWLSIGVFENIFYPEFNRRFTNEVLELTRISQEYPEVYAVVKYRRITNKVVQNGIFWAIVCWQFVAVTVLWVGTISLFLSVFGLFEMEKALTIGLLGTLLFTMTWAGFLIVGNWFCYWFCHGEGQNTHFQMTLWGTATSILMTVG